MTFPVSTLINTKKLFFGAKYSFWICAFTSLLVVIFYDSIDKIIPNILANLDSLLSRRLTLSVIAYKLYGISFLPKSIQYSLVSWKSSYTMQLVIDNAYIKSLVTVGLIYSIIIYYIINKSMKFKFDNYEYALVIFMAISSISESYIYSCYICFPMLILFSKIINNNKVKYLSKEISKTSLIIEKDKIKI